MYSVTITFQSGGMLALKSNTLSKLVDDLKDKLTIRRDWSIVTYENFKDDRDMQLISRMLKP